MCICICLSACLSARLCDLQARAQGPSPGCRSRTVLGAATSLRFSGELGTRVCEGPSLAGRILVSTNGGARRRQSCRTITRFCFAIKGSGKREGGRGKRNWAAGIGMKRPHQRRCSNEHIGALAHTHTFRILSPRLGPFTLAYIWYFLVFAGACACPAPESNDTSCTRILSEPEMTVGVGS